MAYKLSLKKNKDTTIVFLDAITTIPTVSKLPKSNKLDPEEKALRDEFIKTFNDKYAGIAEGIDSNGVSLVVVKAFYFDEFIKPAIAAGQAKLVAINSGEEATQIENALVSGWKTVFDLSPEEIEQYLIKYRRRYTTY